VTVVTTQQNEGDANQTTALVADSVGLVKCCGASVHQIRHFDALTAAGRRVGVDFGECRSGFMPR